MAGSHEPKFGFAFGEGDVEDFFATLDTFEEKLECKRGLAGSRGAFDEVKPVGIKAAAQMSSSPDMPVEILPSIPTSCDAMRLTRRIGPPPHEVLL